MHRAAMGDSNAIRRGGPPADSTAARGPGAWAAERGMHAADSSAAASQSAPSRVFYLDQKGALEVAFVKTGITDGRNTEIVGSSPISEGTKVVIGVNKSGKKNGQSQSQGSSKFSLNPRPQFGPRGGGH